MAVLNALLSRGGLLSSCGLLSRCGLPHHYTTTSVPIWSRLQANILKDMHSLITSRSHASLEAFPQWIPSASPLRNHCHSQSRWNSFYERRGDSDNGTFAGLNARQAAGVVLIRICTWERMT